MDAAERARVRRAAFGLALVALVALAALSLRLGGRICQGDAQGRAVIYQDADGIFRWTNGSRAVEGAIVLADGAQIGWVGGWKGLLLGRKLDLTRAKPEDFQALPGVGPALAREMEFARADRGGFASVKDLATVRGIGPVKLKALAPWFTIGDSR